jgi:hypothetical protein
VNIPKGTWVEIESIVLQPSERAPGLPPETAICPYVLRMSGFLEGDGQVGDEVLVTSLIGLSHRGVLRVVNPGYDHGFGATVPELLHIGIGEVCDG